MMIRSMSRLSCNRSTWRAFPNIKCASWVHENVVLIGDGAHTAHFSIGSGTRLAMEDSIALYKAFREVGDDVKRALARFVATRRPVVEKLLAAARDDAALILDRDPELESDRGQALRVLLYLFEREAAVRNLRSGG